MDKRRLIAVFTLFTLVWTGTLWHDFFGVEVLPLINSPGVASAYADDHSKACTIQKQDDFGLSPTNVGANPRPCPCPIHVHSPSILSLADYSLLVSSLQAVTSFLVLASPAKIGADRSFSYREAYSRVVASKARAPLYISYRSLLI